MFLTSPERTLEVSFRVNQGDNSYMIYASTEILKCFECGDIGHKRFTCPHKDDQQPSTSRGDAHIVSQLQQVTEKQTLQTQEKTASEEVSDVNLNAESIEQPVSETAMLTDTTDVTGVNEMSNAQITLAVERTSEFKETKAGVSEENTIDEVDDMSQCSDIVLRNDDQWSDNSDIVRVAEKDMYTLEEINSFLDETKGKAGVEVSDFFPDLEKFVASVVWARKTSTFDELSQQKRFRLKKTHDCY